MPKAARVGDSGSGHECFPSSPVTSGSPNVSINGLPAARVGDSVELHACTCPQMPHGIHRRTISEGSATVFINGRPAARMGDALSCGGVIESGSNNVFIGDRPWRSPVHDCIAQAVKYGASVLKISPMPDEPPPEPGIITEPVPSPQQAAEKRQQRYQYRNELADRAEKVAELKDSAQRLRFNNDSILHAEAASAVYAVDDYYRDGKAYPAMPVGLKEVDISKIPGLQRNDFVDKQSGFGAALFHSEINGKNILANRGTRVTKIQDWNTNFVQAAGAEARQYKKAMILAKKIKKACTDNPRLMDGNFCDNLVITGHSLGGGLSAAEALVTGFPAYTFNAAGLHDNTVLREGRELPKDAGKNITNIFADHEVLTRFQNTIPVIPKAAGQQVTLPNTATGLSSVQPVVSVMHTVNKYTADLVTAPVKSLAEATGMDSLAEILDTESLTGLVSAGVAAKFLPKIVGYTLAAGSAVLLIDTLIKSVKGHSVTTVIDGIEQQKQADIEHIIKGLQEGTCAI